MFAILKKYSLFIFFFLSISLIFFSKPQQVSAQATCSYVGQCIYNKKCICISACGSFNNRELVPGEEDCGSAIIGGVEAPEAIQNINSASGGEIGLIFFLSRLIKFGSIVAGIFVIWNFIAAGFIYISSAGNTNAHVTVKDKLTWSIIGILVIVSAYTIAGLIGLIFFKDPTFILNPKIEGAI